MDKLLLTLEEAAEVLSIGRTKVYELVRAGLLRSVRIGTSRRIPREALDEFIAYLSDASDHNGFLYSAGEARKSDEARGLVSKSGADAGRFSGGLCVEALLDVSQ